jgi:hypothetical protein
VWRKPGKSLKSKDTTVSVKDGGGNVKAWTCKVASGTGSIIFTDDVADKKSDIMNSEVYWKILQQNITTNGKSLIGCRFHLQADKDSKHTAKATKKYRTENKWKILEWPSQSSDLNPIEHAFYLLKQTILSRSPKNKAQIKEAGREAWNQIYLPSKL